MNQDPIRLQNIRQNTEQSEGDQPEISSQVVDMLIEQTNQPLNIIAQIG